MFSEFSNNGFYARILSIAKITIKWHIHNQTDNMNCLKMTLLSNKAKTLSSNSPERNIVNCMMIFLKKQDEILQ